MILHSFYNTDRISTIITDWCQIFSYDAKCILSRQGGLCLNEQKWAWQRSVNMQIIVLSNDIKLVLSETLKVCVILISRISVLSFCVKWTCPNHSLSLSIRWGCISTDYVISVCGIDMKCIYIDTHFSYLCTKHKPMYVPLNPYGLSAHVLDIHTLPAKNNESFFISGIFCGVCRVYPYILIYIPTSRYYFWGVNSTSIAKWTAKVQYNYFGSFSLLDAS